MKQYSYGEDAATLTIYMNGRVRKNRYQGVEELTSNLFIKSMGDN